MVATRMAERKVDWGRQASYWVRGSSQVNVMYKIIQEVYY